MQRKGINYDVGISFAPEYLSRPRFERSVVQRELEIIRNDLHCNAVRISGTEMNRLIAAAEEALKQGLEVWLSPHLHDNDEQETLAYTVRCAEAAESLRKQWPDLIFIAGCELTLFMQGILEGNDIFERVNHPRLIEVIKSGEPTRKLNAFLKRANEEIRQVFHGKVTYAAAPLEWPDWRPFDCIGLDHYRECTNRASYIEKLKPYFALNKPVIITEVGCCAYQGAQDLGARGFMIIDQQDPPQLNGDYVRDEGVQARELSDVLTLLDGAGVEGVFIFTFVAPVLIHQESPRHDLDLASFSIVKSYANNHGSTYPDMTWEPKDAFKAVANYYAGH
ncbi:abortive infection protein [Ktedonobacter robiniae]|uniref:Abortive infection protein n=1 Tax=Ktedonobacter robiniae TaxID=2778365 RepID=A0ABQ3UVF4_9CHLR|nr:abortive infection protein [Ktedonobacter robiniae]GHO56677.1 hypothetical protein KSB_51520 [Ktedonobacter robiniae]